MKAARTHTRVGSGLTTSLDVSRRRDYFRTILRKPSKRGHSKITFYITFYFFFVTHSSVI